MQTQCHYLPTASERLLLQALLAEEKSAVIAAHAWLDTVELEAVSYTHLTLPTILRV